MLHDADVAPALERGASAQERLVAATKAQDNLAAHPHAAARHLDRLLAAG